MKIFLTGGRGFVGTAVLARLQASGFEVTSLRGDVRDNTTFPHPSFDAVVHLASLISHRGDYSEDLLQAVNVDGTRKLLKHFSRCHFVYVSTIDVERSALSAYAQSKAAAEALVAQAARHCIVRLPSVFGPGQRQQTKLIPRLLRHHVLKDTAVTLTEDQRPYVYVDDAASVIVGGLSLSGLVRLDGVRARNSELARYIAAAAEGRTIEIPAEHHRLYRQLEICVRQLESENGRQGGA